MSYNKKRHITGIAGFCLLLLLTTGCAADSSAPESASSIHTETDAVTVHTETDAETIYTETDADIVSDETATAILACETEIEETEPTSESVEEEPETEPTAKVTEPETTTKKKEEATKQTTKQQTTKQETKVTTTKQTETTAKAAEETTKTPETTKKPEIVIPSCFSVEDGYPSDSLEMAVSLYNQAPQALRDAMESCGTTIYMINDTMLDPDLYYGVKGIIGVTFSNCKMIYLANGLTSVARATIHEMAHLYNNVYHISEEERFNEIFAEESENLYTPDGIAGNYTQKTSEYFAECTKLYVQYPEILMSWGPKTYAYLDELFRE